ncbi:MAG TPA: hypothetical protein DCS87_12545 [Rheinheimera sp.]|nr:hypothetical protein [Rheinheimera sp.]
MMMKANDSILPSQLSNMRAFLVALAEEVQAQWHLCKTLSVSTFDPEQERQHAKQDESSQPH